MSSLPWKYRMADAGLSMLGRLPIGCLYALMAPARFILQRVARYRRKVIRNNLANAFPEKSKAELRAIENGFYRQLCDNIAETVRLKHISDAELSERMKIVNPEMVDDALLSGTPVVLMLGHIGNWEYVPQLTRHVTADVPFGEIYRKMHDAGWGEIIHRLRSRWPKARQIPQGEALRTIVRWNREGAWIMGFLADQRPNSRNLKHWTTFLNQDTPVAVGGEQIGRHTGARYIFADVRKLSRGHYSLTYREITPDPQSESEFPVTERYLRLLEETIRRDPAIWLWSHKRWKYKRPENINDF